MDNKKRLELIRRNASEIVSEEGLKVLFIVGMSLVGRCILGILLL